MSSSVVTKKLQLEINAMNVKIEMNEKIFFIMIISLGYKKTPNFRKNWVFIVTYILNYLDISNVFASRATLPLPFLRTVRAKPFPSAARCATDANASNLSAGNVASSVSASFV